MRTSSRNHDGLVCSDCTKDKKVMFEEVATGFISDEVEGCDVILTSTRTNTEVSKVLKIHPQGQKQFHGMSQL